MNEIKNKKNDICANIVNNFWIIFSLIPILILFYFSLYYF